MTVIKYRDQLLITYTVVGKSVVVMVRVDDRLHLFIYTGLAGI